MGQKVGFQGKLVQIPYFDPLFKVLGSKCQWKGSFPWTSRGFKKTLCGLRRKVLGLVYLVDNEELKIFGESQLPDEKPNEES
eukprot:1935972-Amphidinium_carterae.1